MTITLNSEQELLSEIGRQSRIWDLRQDLSLGDLSTRGLIDEGRE